MGRWLVTRVVCLDVFVPLTRLGLLIFSTSQLVHLRESLLGLVYYRCHTDTRLDKLAVDYTIIHKGHFSWKQS